jgi:rubrerythrin
MAALQMDQIHNVAEFFSYALALEREAVARYQELSRRMVRGGNKAAADLFWGLACFEAEHVKELEGRIGGIVPQTLAQAALAQLEAESPEVVPESDITEHMTAHDALKVALRCEQRAREFFRQIAASVDNPDVQRLAAEMMNEEDEHVHWVESALAKGP